MYGLSTLQSDMDYRGVFINENIGTIIGLDRYEHQDLRGDGQDEFYFEFRHYLNSLRKTNTQALELLFNNNWLSIDPLFLEVQSLKYTLIDSEKLYKSLKGYIQGELKLATGERAGDVGSKRRAQIEKYGFSPKNFSHVLRLCYCGTIFFKGNFFPVNIMRHNEEIGQTLLEIKTMPEKHNKEDLLRMTTCYEDCLDTAFNKRPFTFKFQDDMANVLKLKAYSKILEGYYKGNE
jgi:hypothetical protein